MASDDMLSWLRAVVEGDKAAAEATSATPHRKAETASADHAAWSYSGESGVVMCGCGVFEGVASGNCGCCWPDAEGREVDLAHIALHDPRDTIARCEAELALLDDHAEATAHYAKHLEAPAGEVYGLWVAIKRLLSGYQHREGFNPDWQVG